MVEAVAEVAERGREAGYGWTGGAGLGDKHLDSPGTGLETEREGLDRAVPFGLKINQIHFSENSI